MTRAFHPIDSYQGLARYTAAQGFHGGATAGAGQVMLASVASLVNRLFISYDLTKAGMDLTYGIGKAAVSSFLNLGNLGIGRPEYSTPFYESQQSYTMRQAGLQAIHNSQYGRGSYFGREAELFHS